MYRIAVCEDEKTELEQIIRVAKEILKRNELVYHISKYENGEELLTAIQKGMEFDLLLVDVLLKGMNGIEFAAQLRKQKNDTAIVFVSWSRDMALQGYEVEAVRYLAKPIEPKRLEEALLFCYERKKKPEILLPTANGQCRISSSDIMYAEAQGRNVKLILTTEEIEVNIKISELKELLSSKQFVFSHRAYLVNLAFIKYIRCYEIELTDGRILPISKYRISQIKEMFVRYLED